MIAVASVRPAAWWVAASILGVGALAIRGVGPYAWFVAVCGGVVALALPVREHLDQTVWWRATCTGMVAVMAVRFMASAPSPATKWGIVAAAVTGVAEEAIFRRGLYGLLERRGAVVAVVGSAAAFALTHVPAYGWRVLALDFAAGLVFGWQRWASGHWSSPATTHAFANILAHI